MTTSLIYIRRATSAFQPKNWTRVIRQQLKKKNSRRKHEVKKKNQKREWSLSIRFKICSQVTKWQNNIKIEQMFDHHICLQSRNFSITNLAYRTSFPCNSLSFHEKICSCLHNNICPGHNNGTSAFSAVDSSEESGSGLSMAVFDKSSLVVMVRGKVS